MTQASAQAEFAKGYDIHLQGRAAEAEPFYRRAVGLDPELKEAWMNLGLAALSLGEMPRAEACQREALRLDPDCADAHNNLGMIHYRLGRIAEAESCFRSALRLRPEHPNATLNLGAARELGDHVTEAEELFRRALALGADPARALSNLALAMMEQARPAEAEAACRQALALRPDHAEARANLAMALLIQGRLAEGWRAYESRWEVEGIHPDLPAPRWTGQPLNGETVLLYAEQGFGDVLQFCRFAPMVAAAGGRVVLVVPKALHRLMLTLGDIAEVIAEEDGLLPRHFDYHCPLMSLPFAFGTTLDTIPFAAGYLRADPALWAGFLKGLPGLKVGLAWAGKSRTAQPHAVAIDKRRSMRLADIAPLLSVPGCSFVSLQLEPPAAQMAGVAGLINVADRLGDWSDTAGLIAGLDLVITVDTAVAHLAGALGRPVWMLNRLDSCWRWLLGRDDTPWYSSMRQFRQVRRGEWSEVIGRVRAALSERVGL